MPILSPMSQFLLIHLLIRLVCRHLSLLDIGMYKRTTDYTMKHYDLSDIS